MIIMGLLGGLKSIAYIVLLMFLVFYMYAIVGVMFLRDYDAVHFKSLEISMLTLLRISTLDVSEYSRFIFFIKILYQQLC